MIIKEKRHSAQIKCSCGRLQWCKKGSLCYNENSCVRCLIDRQVGEGKGEPLVKLSKPKTIRRYTRKITRNELCPCGSGRKYKHCCIIREEITLSLEPPQLVLREQKKEARHYKKTYERITKWLFLILLIGCITYLFLRYLNE